MTIAAVTSKNQLTLPKEVRQKLGIVAGDRVSFEPLPDGRFRVAAHRPADWRKFSGCLDHLLKKGKKPVSIEEMDEASGDFLAEDNRRISRGEG